MVDPVRLDRGIKVEYKATLDQPKEQKAKFLSLVGSYQKSITKGSRLIGQTKLHRLNGKPFGTNRK